MQDSNSNYSSDSKAQLHINLKIKKDISAFVKHRAGCPLSQFLEQFVKHIQNTCSFCAFQGIFTPALRTNTYDV